MAKKILVIDDDPFTLKILDQELTDAGYDVVTASGGEEGLARVESAEPDAVLLDYMLPGMDGLEVLKRIRAADMSLPVIVMTAHGSVERAVLMVKAGAFDFITKPFETDHVLVIIGNALERTRIKRSVALLSEEVNNRYGRIVGTSAGIRAAASTAEKVARSSATVLLLGESGTGKELFARVIHQWSDRCDQPLVAVNCVGLTRELLESELFGHEKGAFTGAHQLKKGKMELADGGTVFLDEVGDIPLELQTRLLRFLQEREFERVGGTKSIKVDVRVVAATNRDLAGAVEDGSFRKDLFFRLNVVPIVVPPLRERTGDIPELARFFLRRFSAEAKKSFDGVTGEAVALLASYDWPGNVRELANTIERAVVLGEGPLLDVPDLPPAMAALRPLGADEPEMMRAISSYHQAVEEFKRELLTKTLDGVEGNRSAAARALNLQRTYFLRLIRNLGIGR